MIILIKIQMGLNGSEQKLKWKKTHLKAYLKFLLIPNLYFYNFAQVYILCFIIVHNFFGVRSSQLICLTLPVVLTQSWTM